jgi:hypothetical protein
MDVAASPATNTLGGLGSPRNNNALVSSQPHPSKQRYTEDIFNQSNTFAQTTAGVSAFGGSNQQKLDVWKLLIRDEAERFLVESEEKKMKKKMTQADYKSYLDRQMDLNKA